MRVKLFAILILAAACFCAGWGASRIGGTTDARDGGRGLIETRVTLHVPGDHETITAALAALKDKRIAPGGLVVIALAAGDHACPGVVSHPDGARIQIIGAPQAPAGVRLFGSQARYGACFLVKNNDSLGLIDGFVAQSTDGLLRPCVWDHSNLPYGFGAWAYMGGAIAVGPHVTWRGWYYGERAELAGKIINGQTATGGVVADLCGDACFHAFNGGTLEARGARAERACDVKSYLGYGFMAELGGSLVADKAVASRNARAGFAALNGGSMWAMNAMTTDNGQNGVRAFVRASIDATQTQSSDNGVAWRPGQAYAPWSWATRDGGLYVQTNDGCRSGPTPPPPLDGPAASQDDGSCRWTYFGRFPPGAGMVSESQSVVVAFKAVSMRNGADGFLANGGALDANAAQGAGNGGLAWRAINGGNLSAPPP